MSRLLIGVSGGIAAYKALETARLAIKAGHAVRVIQTPASERFVGRTSFEAITGAPVLTSEFEPDPARGAYPGRAAARARADQPPRAGRARRAVPDRAGDREHDRQARRTATPTTSSRTAALAAACPVAIAPAMNNRMYLHAGDAGEPRAAGGARGDRDPAGRGRARLPRRARDRPARRARAAARRVRARC